MANILNFSRLRRTPPQGGSSEVAGFLQDFSIEVMPRTAAKIDDFRAILPAGTRVYVAHIDGFEFDAMLATARRLVDEGFQVMPHFPARGIIDRNDLRNRIAAYSDVGVRQALVLAGGIDKPHGAYSDSMQLLETGLFDEFGFTDLHVAGHPEGNMDIDPDGSTTHVTHALQWKNDFQTRTDARMAIATQFCFESQPVIDWCDRLRENGITLPVHIGVAGPAKLQTMIKFAMACGVGPSLRVLQKRATDLSKLVLPFEPDQILSELAAHKARNPDFAVERVHFFPLGGITKTTEYVSGATSTENIRARA
ncbi:methylenetetrahydrofolate reductase [Amaricoccus tamworthensis]|uniref:methylenetetrahydrofolate reductase n=1 Tax=Amaricoccus tamworthensis TaxID=57002 RepID=UPI003C7D4704